MIRFTRLLLLCMLLLQAGRAAAVNETGALRLHVRPGKSDGVYQLLRRHGLPADRERFILFLEMNADLMADGDALHLDRSYALPVLSIPIDRPLDAIFEAHGVLEHRRELIEYNRMFNPDFLTGEKTENAQVWTVWIPEKRSGFFDGGVKTGRTETHDRQRSPAPAEVEGERTVDPALEAPYPKIKAAIDAGSASSRLSGYCFVLDAGHGGNDPGTMPTVMRGDGRNTEAIEAPLVYDVTLRLLRHIMLNGGIVFVTHYSPDFGIKDVKDPRGYRTQKYNISSADIRTDSPAHSIRERKRIAGAVIARNYHKGRKVVFISIHADYLADSRDQPITVFYHRLTRLDGGRSRAFARRLAKAVTGATSNSKPRGLGVLYKNPSDLEILVELANLNNTHGAWRLRYHSYREKLAETLCDGLMEALE